MPIIEGYGRGNISTPAPGEMSLVWGKFHFWCLQNVWGLVENLGVVLVGSSGVENRSGSHRSRCYSEVLGITETAYRDYEEVQDISRTQGMRRLRDGRQRKKNERGNLRISFGKGEDTHEELVTC